MAENGFYASAVFRNSQAGGLHEPESAFFPTLAKRAVGIRRSVVGYADSILQTTDS